MATAPPLDAPSEPAAPAAAPPAALADVALVPAGLGRLAARLPIPPRALLPAAIAAAAVVGLLGWLLLAPPARAPLYGSLPDADKAAVVAALETAGMAVAIDPRTGAVMLPPGDHARARMLLAGQGLPRAAPGGAELLADMPLGSSRAIEGARLKAAQERELARSIESLHGVESARVIIAQPEPSPFVRERAPVTASVSVSLAPGRSLSDSQTRAIVHLVAGAVPGLSPDRVAIADQTGRLLSGEPGATGDRAEDRRLAMQARLEARGRESILALLGPMLGRDNVAAQVAVELDFAARDSARERYDRDGALRSEATSRTTSSEPRAIGIPGALTNTLPAAAAVGAAPPPAVAAGPTVETTQSESATRNFELGRSVEVTSEAGGTIRRLTAAVVIRADALGPPAGRAAALREIEALVAGAIGADPGRGDRIAVSARSFMPPEEPSLPIWREPVVLESSKWLAAALVAVAVLAFLVRPVMRPLAQRLALPAPTPAARAAASAGAAAVDGGTLAAGAGRPRLPVDYGQKLAEARLLAATDAARATAVARRLLAEEPAR